MQFVNTVAAIAEEHNHHPNILISYNTVTLELTTHDEGGVTDKDGFYVFTALPPGKYTLRSRAVDATTSAALPEAAVSSSGRSEDEPEADSGSGSGSDGGEPPDTGANGAASDHPDRKRHPSNKPKTPTKTACTLSIAGGIPLPTAQNLSLNVGGQLYDIEGKTVDVEFDGEFTAVRVNDKRWTASRKITISDCEAGPVPVAIKPLAARVKFKGRPGPSQGLVVICREGCRASLQGRNQNAKDFQAVPIPTGKAVQHVKLELKAEHYEAKIIERDLLPGPNEIEVYLVKHSAGG